MLRFDYRKLKGRIVEVYGSQKQFAAKMGVSQRTMSLKMRGKIYFRQDEIAKASKLLKVDYALIRDYFFTPKVQ